MHALADGASSIWKAVQRVFTGCVQTLDLFHACAHLHKCAERIYGEATQAAHVADQHCRALLIRQGWAGVSQEVAELLAIEDANERERRRSATDRLIGCFAKHGQRLNYAERLQAGRAIGSGQVEGQAKTLGPRLKRRRTLEQTQCSPHGELGLRPSLLAMGRLLGHGHLITPRRSGYTLHNKKWSSVDNPKSRW